MGTERQKSIDVAKVQGVGEKLQQNISRVIVGKSSTIRLLLVAMLSEGHVLLEDVPGVGKTMLARSVAISLGGSFSRIQFTPDLLPSDVTGVSVYDPGSRQFVFHPGPIMAQVVLADEINRATPRTQSSLLECMGERQVTVDNETHALPQPFFVLATQNPVEFEGTFPLPEAQLDRFLMKLALGYPTLEEESEILLRQRSGHPIQSLEPCTTPEEFMELQRIVKEVFVEASVREYIVRLVQATRNHPDVALGASPRASLALFRAGQAYAALDGRDYVVPDDIKALAVPIIAHRLILRPESQLRGITRERLVEGLLETVPVQFETL